MKRAIIATVDALVYLSFIIVSVAAMVALVQGKIAVSLTILVGGWLVCSLLSGVWFVLSDIADSARKIANSRPMSISVADRIIERSGVAR
jgi:type IV secretory pathway TrbD component